MDETVTKGLVNQNSQSAIEPATVEAKTNPAERNHDLRRLF
jgi:hypothetical protein